MVTKDFLFLNYSHVYGSTTYFKYILSRGHTGDIADETNYESYLADTNVRYRVIVVYLHKPHQLELINKYIDSRPDSMLVQHDDTDIENIQNWTRREPDVYMRREHTAKSIGSTTSPVIPFHFPMESIDRPGSEKVFDVCFVGTMTHPRRQVFINALMDLAEGDLKHLHFYVDVTPYPQWVPGDASDAFRSAVNRSKVAIHYFGNSYDSTRIWEILSCNTALLMPRQRVVIPEQPLEDGSYEILQDDCSDLKEKILGLLKGDRWKEVAKKGQACYNAYHTRDKCCEYYYSKLLPHLRRAVHQAEFDLA